MIKGVRKAVENIPEKRRRKEGNGEEREYSASFCLVLNVIILAGVAGHENRGLFYFLYLALWDGPGMLFFFVDIREAPKKERNCIWEFLFFFSPLTLAP